MQNCTPVTDNDPENKEQGKEFKEANVKSELKWKRALQMTEERP